LDGDTVPADSDNCPSTWNPNQDDNDGDGVGDACDRCPSQYGPEQFLGCPLVKSKSLPNALGGIIQSDDTVVSIDAGPNDLAPPTETTNITIGLAGGYFNTPVHLSPAAGYIQGFAYNISGDGKITGEVALTLDYGNTSGLTSEEELQIYDIIVYDEQWDTWVPMHAEQNTDTNTLIINLTEFGNIYAIFMNTDVDDDKDGITDEEDNCPHTYNPDQTDSDMDGVGDVCDYPDPENTPPVCSLAVQPTAGNVSLMVTFTLNVSDADGTISSWLLDVDNDGTADYSGSGMPPVTQSHNYAVAGFFTARLTVTDDDDATSTDSQTIIVNDPTNQPPNANFTYTPISPVKPEDVIAFTDGSFDSDGSIVNWTWDFGDGNSSYSQNPTHIYTKTGTYIVTLTVIDEGGGIDNYSLSIEVKQKKDGTPGFELVFVIGAVMVIMFIKRRKHDF
jgi:PKD repeat protein